MTDVVLQLCQIEKSFGDVKVLDGIDLSVRRGEFITLLGPSGCGKTTTLRIIAGLETPDRGRVIIEGKDVTGEEPNKRNVSVRKSFSGNALVGTQEPVCCLGSVEKYERPAEVVPGIVHP